MTCWVRLMRKGLLATALIVGWLCQPCGVAAEPESHVVVISIDGFPAYLLDDPAAPIPTIRKLARQGLAASDGMTVVNPSVTWPNHTTLMTGVYPAKHSVLFNGVLVRREAGQPVEVDPRRDQSDLVAVPTLFDRFHAAGLRTAAINWPCTRSAKGIDDNFPDVPEMVKHMTPRLREELVREGILPDETDKSFASLSAAARDQVWAGAASHIIRARKPHLLMLHLLICDGVHHRHGPKTLAGYTAVALADAHVAQVLRAIDEAGIRDRTTVFVVADHGFATATKLVQPNVLLRKEKLLEIRGDGQVAKARVQVVPEGGIGMVYCTDPATAGDDAERVARLFTGHEGIAQVVRPAGFAELGLPDPAKNPQMANLVLVAADGYGVSGTAYGENVVVPIETGKQNVGYHGYVSSDDRMNAVFIAAGRGVRSGTKVEDVRSVDLAPTVAALLGHELADADGQVLKTILAGQEAAGSGTWRPLFNGKDLEGWKPIGSAVWRVVDGVIVGGQDGDPRRSGLLTTTDQFQDFELELEFMIDEHGKYNSGVYLRNEPGRGGRSGYQINIGRAAAEEYTGLFLRDWLDKGDERDEIRKVLDWNKLRIVARGPHIRADLNGVNIVDYSDPNPDPKLLQRGVLAFQTYGAEGHAGWVKFRNIRIREIKAAKQS